MRGGRVGVALLAFIATVGLAAWLSARVASGRLAEELRAIAVRESGRILSWDSLETDVGEARAVLRGASLSGDGRGEPPLATAARVTADLETGGLFWRSVVVERVVFEGATLRFVDRGVWPEVTWELSGMRGHVTPMPGGSFEFDALGDLASGGRLHARGSISERVFLRLDGVNVAPLLSYTEGLSGLGGRASGDVTVVGPAADPLAVEGVVAIEDALLRTRDLSLRGPLRIELDAARKERLLGTFEIDATGAELEYTSGISLRASAGGARFSGRLSELSDGRLAFEDLRISLRQLSGSLDASRPRR